MDELVKNSEFWDFLSEAIYQETAEKIAHGADDDVLNDGIQKINQPILNIIDQYDFSAKRFIELNPVFISSIFLTHKTTDVTDSFDRSRIYCRVLRPNDDKYKPGPNSADNTIDTTDNDLFFWSIECGEKEGGFYFTSIEHILNYAYGWGHQLCFVTVPDDATVYQQDPDDHFGDEVWRASEIVLSEPQLLTEDFVEDLISMGAIINNYNISMHGYHRDSAGFKLHRCSEFDNAQVDGINQLFDKYYDKNKKDSDKSSNSGN